MEINSSKASALSSSTFSSVATARSPISQAEIKLLNPHYQITQRAQAILQQLQSYSHILHPQLAPFYLKALRIFFEKLIAPSIDFSRAQFSTPVAPAMRLEEHLRFLLFAHAARLSPDSCARLESYFESLAFLPAFEQAKELLRIEVFFQNLNMLCTQILQLLSKERSCRWEAIAEWIANQLIAQLGELSRRARDPIARSRIQFFALYLRIKFFPILNINSGHLSQGLPPKQPLPHTLVEKLNQVNIRLAGEIKNRIKAEVLTYVAQPRQQIEKICQALCLKINRQSTLQLMQSCLPNYPHLAKAIVHNWRRLHAVPGFISPCFLPKISIRYNIQPHVEELPDGSLQVDLTRKIWTNSTSAKK